MHTKEVIDRIFKEPGIQYEQLIEVAARSQSMTDPQAPADPRERDPDLVNAEIALQRAAIADVCRRYQVRRLEVFGSAARGTDFDPDRSDADFLVEFAPDAQADLGGWFSVRTELERLLGRGVDLVEYPAVRNPYVRADIERTRELVYAA